MSAELKEARADVDVATIERLAALCASGPFGCASGK